MKPTVKIHTKRVKIENAEIGMFVRSFNINSQQDEFREILNTFRPVVEYHRQYTLIMKDGGTIITSDKHPMLVLRDQWQYIPTSDVKVGEIIKDRETTNIVVDIKIGGNYDENFADIEVDYNNNYYATSNNSSNMYVVHNSCSVNYPGWHLEFEKLIELKNNKGTEETRIRTLDYVVAINGLMIKRLITGGNITFFSPEEVPDLYEAFYSPDTYKFEELYIKYENNSKIVKKSMPAYDFFSKLLSERFETGRIYIFFADNVNSQSPFYENIYMTNLCTEIALHTKPMAAIQEMIALCTLGGVNMGKFGKVLTEKEENLLKSCCEMLVRGLDALLSYQQYPVAAAWAHTDKYRPLGIGVIGYAHWLAKGRLSWGQQETCECTEHFMESMSYYLVKASNELAKEFGAIQVKSKYSDGIFAHEMAKVKPVIELKHDWEELRASLKQSGIRNITLSTFFPAETSSQLSNETNGIEPPRDLISIKGSKDGVLPQVVPDYTKLNNVYQTLWEVESRDYLTNVSSFQKFNDQAISCNTSYNPAKGEISMSKLIDDLIFAYSQGVKTFYYSQTNDLGGEDDGHEEDGCASGACKL